MRGIRHFLADFWREAYADNLTGMAAMVAYNLLLSIFPVALIALFITGQVLSSPELEESVLIDLQDLFPTTAAGSLSDALRQVRDSSTTVGLVALVTSLWFGGSFWGALDTAFCQIYAVPCRSWVRQKLFGLGMVGVVLIFFAATVAIPAGQALLAANADELPFGLDDRRVLFLLTLGAGLVVTFLALTVIYRTVPNCAVGWNSVWPGALVATIAIGIVDYGFPLYLSSISSLARVGSTLVFILIVLIWFYALAIIILGGAVVNELRLVQRRSSDNLAAMPDPITEELRIEQAERERKEHKAAEESGDETETAQHERRAERASYLEEKLSERAAAEDAAAKEA
jgi:YihY family inner membrane protein